MRNGPIFTLGINVFQLTEEMLLGTYY